MELLKINKKDSKDLIYKSNNLINSKYSITLTQARFIAFVSSLINAYDKDFSNDTEYSVGLGVRWASPIGPIRIDVASGISDDNHPIRLHFFIGSQL